MILPSKHIPETETILGIGASLLKHLRSPKTPTDLWKIARKHKNVGTYERFILGLDLLFILGTISLENGLLKRRLA